MVAPKKALDPSTLNFNKRENPNSQKTYQNRFSKNLHIANSFQDLVKMVIPRGIDLKTYGPNVHKNHLAEGCLVTVFCNNINPNELCRREYDEMMNFINTKLKVIRENPYELKGMQDTSNIKIVTEIDNEEKADLAYNLEQDPDTKKVFGRL